MRPTIYLDMDGVITNFVGGVFDLYGLGQEDKQRAICYWPVDTPGVHKIVEDTHEGMWAKIIEAGPDWWADLHIYPWGLDLIEGLTELGELKILSSPAEVSKARYVVGGKCEWLERIFGKNFKNFHLTPIKEDCADCFSILIDDHRENCRRFVQAGGHALLFDQPWSRSIDGNRGYDCRGVLDEVQNFVLHGPKGLKKFNFGEIT